jgi:hypothetical protein
VTEAEATPTLIHHALDVNSWAKNDPDVEAARPSHCPGCGLAAHRGDRLRLHGHGRRERDLWGLVEVGAGPGLRTILRCVECGKVCTVAPRGVGPRLRYALAAVGSAMLLWGVWLWTAARTRQATSPNLHVGFSEPRRWRSLGRWSRRAAEIFELLELVHGATARDIARRVAKILIARGPPELDERCRVVAGAHAP